MPDFKGFWAIRGNMTLYQILDAAERKIHKVLRLGEHKARGCGARLQLREMMSSTGGEIPRKPRSPAGNPDDDDERVEVMVKRWIAIILLLLVSSGAACSGETVDALTYAVFPYVPDVEHYQELVESRWAEIEPDIKLVRAEWNCYHDGAPEGIDVVMYDAIKRDALIEAGWIQPIEPDAVQNAGDIFPFALEGFTVDGRLYGIPAFLCGNYLIYDRDCGALAGAEHITENCTTSLIRIAVA